MPIIPDYVAAGGQQRPSAPGVGSAMATGQSVAALGQSVQNTGETMAAEKRLLDEVKAEAERNRARLAIQQATSQNIAYRKKNPDTTGWEADLKSRLATARTGLGVGKHDIGAIRQVNQIFTEAGEQAGSEVKQAAKLHRFHDSRVTATELAESYMRHGDHESAARVYQDSRAFSPEEKEDQIGQVRQEHAGWQRAQALRREQDVVEEYPGKYLRDWPAGTVPPGMDPQRHLYLRERAVQADKEEQLLTLTTLRAAMFSPDGKTPPRVLTAADIDEFASHSHPAVREQAKRELAYLRDPRLRAEHGTEAYQSRVVGQVFSAISVYEPLTDEGNARYVELEGHIRTLPEGSAVRDELARKLEEKRGGTAGTGTEEDEGLKSLEIARQHGLFGQMPRREPASVERLLRSGFLGDAGKLKQLALTDEQVRGVVQPPGSSGASPARLAELRREAFLQLAPVWERRGTVTADPLVVATAEAILDGRETVEPQVSTEQRRQDATREMEIHATYGAAVTSFLNWRKRNPEADQAAIREKVISLSEQPRQAELSRKYAGSMDSNNSMTR